MGAWSFIRSELESVIKKSGFTSELAYFGRSRRATPAVGLEKLHFIEQDKVIKAALESSNSVEI